MKPLLSVGLGLFGVVFVSCTTNSGVSDFDSCVAAGNPIMESYPEQCSDGTNSFTKDYSGEFCGGIAAFSCPYGYSCELDGDFPDAGGVCIIDENGGTSE